MIQRFLEPFKREKQKAATFNGMDAKEWVMNSSSVWRGLSSPRTDIEKLHGATFPAALVEKIIKIYSKKGDLILDPFMGVGTSGIVADKLERLFIGVELKKEFYDISCNRIPLRLDKGGSPTNRILLNGDCIEEVRNLAYSRERTPDLFDNKIQLSVTSPPYADLIHKVEQSKARPTGKLKDNHTKVYSDDPRDLGNMEINSFTAKINDLMESLYKVHKEESYSVWVVKDYRDMRQNIPYVDLHSVIAESGKRAGFQYHDLIVWDQSENKKLMVLGYPSRFYANILHSFIVVLKKGTKYNIKVKPQNQ